MQRDEALTGLARGLRLPAGRGAGHHAARPRRRGRQGARPGCARACCASTACASGSSRSSCRLLKPAPTRLRLVLWSLVAGSTSFPRRRRRGSSPMPANAEAPRAIYTMSGYRPPAHRAIRIDMLERLADMLRAAGQPGRVRGQARHALDHRLTLEQFADLMAGPRLQGRARRAGEGEATRWNPRRRTGRAGTTDEIPGDTPPELGRHAGRGARPTPQETPGGAARRRPDLPPRRRPNDPTPPRRRRRRFRGGRIRLAWKSRRSRSSSPSPGRRAAAAEIVRSVVPRVVVASPVAEAAEGRRRQAARRGKGPGGKGGRDRQEGPRTFTARPEKPAKVDPDNPFAVLAALKDKS
jgi:ATP-dependent RNA helicase SUPV3L1/SUV3